MEIKSFPGRLQRNRCKCLSLPAAKPISRQPASPGPPQWDVVAHWTKLKEKQKRTLRENRSWIFPPKPLEHVPYSSAQAGWTQTQVAAASAAGTGCGSPRWSQRGSLPQPNPYRSSMEIQRPSTWDCLKHQSTSSSHICRSWQTASTCLFYFKKKKNPTPKKISYCQQNFIFLPHFLLYLFFVNPHRMGNKMGRMTRSQSWTICFC